MTRSVPTQAGSATTAAPCCGTPPQRCGFIYTDPTYDPHRDCEPHSATALAREAHTVLGGCIATAGLRQQTTRSYKTPYTTPYCGLSHRHRDTHRKDHASDNKTTAHVLRTTARHSEPADYRRPSRRISRHNGENLAQPTAPRWWTGRNEGSRQTVLPPQRG